ncbi:UPF0149 family protein [Chthonobacter rhizosphaerae]|uniref:UPF0149 family protein n=1 Tax=Chthonobacter rhizosphaerae TaxID=2735553 RepID=UPI0015EF9BD8|nr:UPF0149 family protein [Chthonobacter rhizosphaerae]
MSDRAENHDLPHRLRWAKPRPSDEDLREAVERADDLEPQVRAVLDTLGRGGIALPEDEQMMLYALPAMAAAGRAGLFGPLLQALDTNPLAFERFFGDAMVSELASILATLHDGDAEALKARFLSRGLPPTTWPVLLYTIARLAFDGRIERAAVDTMMLSAFDLRLDRHDELVRIVMEDVIAGLGLPRAMAKLRQAHKQLAAQGDDLGVADLEAMYARAVADPSDPTNFEEIQVVPVTDPAAGLTPLDPQAYVPGMFGVAEVRAQLPAHSDEIAWLIETLYLVGGEDALTFEEMDGFLTGVAVGPLTVPEDEWFPILLAGPDAETVPPFPDEAIEARAREIARRHLNARRTMIEEDQPYEIPVAPLGDGSGAGWAAGFLFAVNLDDTRWTAFIQRAGAVPILETLVVLAAPPGRKMTRRMAADARAEFFATLPTALAALARARRGGQPMDARALPVVEASYAGVGRNDPCPCGSGRKFKKCHGA